jgi:hypothetical protein
LGSAVASSFGFSPEGFGFGVPAPSLSESALFSAGFADSDEVVPFVSDPGGLSALATPTPAIIAADMPAVTTPAPNHTKDRVHHARLLSPTAETVTRVVSPRGRIPQLTLADSSAIDLGI